MSMLGTENPDYQGFVDADEETVKREVRTQQSFKDQCDVNKIIDRHQINVANSHIQDFPPEAYGELTGVDLLTAHNHIERAHTIFNALPSEVRNEFDNNALKFAMFASDPENVNRLPELLPDLARPGRQFNNPIKRGAQGAGEATSRAPQAASAAADATPAPDQSSPPPAADTPPGAPSADPASSST